MNVHGKLKQRKQDSDKKWTKIHEIETNRT